MAGRSRSAAVRFALALHAAVWVALVALPLDASTGHGSTTARALAGDDTSDVGTCSAHLLQTGSNGLRQQVLSRSVATQLAAVWLNSTHADERRRAHDGHQQSNVKDASLAKDTREAEKERERDSPLVLEPLMLPMEEPAQRLKGGHCASLTCTCHRLHIEESLNLSATIVFVVTALVLGSFVGCGQSLAHTGTPLKEWYAKRLIAVFGVSALFVLGYCYAVHRCAAGHLEFVHIPKNGGSSVEAAGLAAGFNWSVTSSLLLGQQKMPPDGRSPCSRHHVPPALLTGRSPYVNARTFCVTRDPYQRAVSEYLYLFLTDRGGHGEYLAWRDQTGLYDFPECSSEGLNHYVRTTLELYKQGRKFVDDCHHLPQVDYIFDKHGRRTCDIILRLEEFPDSFDRLMRENGYPVSLPTTPQFDSSQVCWGLSAKNLTEQTRQLLREVYADDFRLLGYTT